MKMVKSLLLGSAAGVVAVATGQAADLPVKAKPVEYVKVCSLYGAGFFYIPGTDKCIKIGGYLREQWDIHGAGDGQAYADTNGGTWTRGFTDDHSFRTRSSITFDVREQSSFGTVRGYTAVGGDLTTGNSPAGAANALYFTRSFVQFAGFTTGKAVSFFDFLSTDPYLYQSNVRANWGNTGATGIDVFAYTAQLGNGVSATVSGEDSCASNIGANGAATGGRGCKVLNTSVVGSLAPGVATIDAQGYLVPDVVGALRADQAWGSAQVMGAWHRDAGAYYGTASPPLGQANNGHPSDANGWAAGAGFLLKNVLGMQGDQFGVQANYSVGAVSYMTNAAASLAGFSGGDNGLGNSIYYSHVVDGVYSSGTLGNSLTGTNIELTTAWTIGAVYEHVWNPQWKTSLFGGYVNVSYTDTAANYMCNGNFKVGWARGQSSNGYVGPGAVNAGAAGVSPQSAGGAVGSGVSSCDPNNSFWMVNTRTQWNPNSNLDLGVDFGWQQFDDNKSGVYNSGATAYGGRPAGLYNVSNYGVFNTGIRAQYNFLP